MVLKGLPPSYNSCCTVITQKNDALDFVKFKSCLRSFEESENFRNTMEQDNVMELESKGNPGNCWTCGLPGHKQHQCNLHNQAGKKSAISWRTAHSRGHKRAPSSATRSRWWRIRATAFI